MAYNNFYSDEANEIEIVKAIEKKKANIQEEAMKNAMKAQLSAWNKLADQEIEAESSKLATLEYLKAKADRKKFDDEIALNERINKRLIDKYKKQLDDLAAAKEASDAEIAAKTLEQDKEIAKIQRKLRKQVDGEEKDKLKVLLEEAKQKKKDFKDEQKRLDEAHKKDLDRLKEKAKKEEDFAKRKQDIEKASSELKGAFDKGLTFSERKEKLKNAFTDEDGKFDFGKATSALAANIRALLDKTIDEIALKKGAIDTRLQGYELSRSSWLAGGSYWDNFNTTIKKIGGASPFFKQETVINKLSDMVNQGIAFNVEQRAFLATVQDKIATTFNATNGTLLRLVRIQQEDTTAARLGMESALTAFLNNMYKTTEYMQGIAESVKGSIEESMALMSGKSAVGYEYQVQKWLGSLYSVGMGQSSVSGISSALGQLSAGLIEGINGGGSGNLLVMAANNAGLSIADILAKGLDESSTNVLMQAVVDYLGKIYNDTKDSRVVQQQFAKVFGVTASDLKAAASLASSRAAITNNYSNYDQSLTRLSNMSSTMYKRMSIGEGLGNAWSNFQYTMASGIANNPILYGIYKSAGLLKDLMGGINIPAISVMGNMVDLETNVADLMTVGALSGSALSGLGGIVSSIADIFSGGVNGALTKLGAFGSNTLTRGRGTGLTVSGFSQSSSGYISNSSSSDIQNSTINSATDESNQKLIEAKNDESADVDNKTINNSIVAIYTLLQELVHGNALNVHVENTDELKYDMGGLMSL